MSTYVDALIVYTNRPPFHKGSCHLVADTLEELHSMAQSIGMKREWFQESASGVPHYDLVPSRRDKAIKKGAIEIDRKQFIEIANKLRPVKI